VDARRGDGHDGHLDVVASPCLSFLAGPLVDLASSAALVLVLFGNRQHWIQLDPTLVLVIRACLFQYLARLLWQFELYVATDFYYVVGVVSGCKNLLQDTQTYVLNQLARVVPRIQTRDQSAVPRAELRVVRWFAVFWLLGRGVAFGTLFWITLPVLVGYAVVLAHAAVDEGAIAPAVEGPLMPLIVIVVQAIGLVMWIRGSVRVRRSA
jgi:putative peptide zinc metalloprotease protein